MTGRVRRVLLCVAALSLACPLVARAADQGVAINSAGFRPVEVTIAEGEKVTWTNEDRVEHTVTSDRRAFDSGRLAPRGRYILTFKGAGLFPYHCAIHPNLKGLVRVNRPGAATTTVTGPATTTTSSPATTTSSTAAATTSSTEAPTTTSESTTTTTELQESAAALPGDDDDDDDERRLFGAVAAALLVAMALAALLVRRRMARPGDGPAVGPAAP